MPKNDIQTLSPQALSALGHRLLAAVGSTAPNSYSVPAVQLSAIEDAISSLDLHNTAVENAKAAYHAAIANREASRVDAAAAVAQVARTIYAVPTNTSGMIANAGLSPRATTRTRLLPSAPVELTALSQPTGTVQLKWSRCKNGDGVKFIVEAQVGTGDWAYVQETGATRLTLSGYAPGTPVAFRVSASANKQTSEPCAPVTLWPSSAASAPALRLAA